ncbi:MAG: type II toxin-antitoxin system YafQ family toxin [Candidatus Babeliales bacterium]
MLEPIYEKKFLKEIKLAKKRGKNLEKLKQIINMLIEEKQLPQKNQYN